MPRRNTAQKQKVFLTCIADGDTVTDAAGSAGVARQTPYQWEHTDEAFAKAWAEVRETRHRQYLDAANDLALQGSEPMLRFLILRSDREAVRRDARPAPVTEIIITGEANDDGPAPFIQSATA